MTKKELFLSLVKPNKNGVLRWVSVSEFVGKYESLKLGNGGSWCRASSNLAKEFIVEFDKSQSSGNSIDAIKLNGFNTRVNFNQNIRADIKDFYKSILNIFSSSYFAMFVLLILLFSLLLRIFTKNFAGVTVMAGLLSLGCQYEIFLLPAGN